MQQIIFPDIQFQDTYTPDSLRRFAQQVKTAVTQINAVIAAINDLQSRLSALENP